MIGGDGGWSWCLLANLIVEVADNMEPCPIRQQGSTRQLHQGERHTRHTLLEDEERFTLPRVFDNGTGEPSWAVDRKTTKA